MDIDSVIKRIDDMTEAQAKNMLEYIASKQQMKVKVKERDGYYCLMGVSLTKRAEAYIGCNLDFAEIHKDMYEKTSIHKNLLKMLFNMMYIHKQPIAFPYLEDAFPVFMPIDKTLEEWLIEMDLNS